MREIDRRIFLSLNQDNTNSHHFYILCDGWYVDSFCADSEEEARKIFAEYKR